MSNTPAPPSIDLDGDVVSAARARILWRQWAMNTAVNAAAMTRPKDDDGLIKLADKIYDWVRA